VARRTADRLEFRHVDVFTRSAFSGNGLIVVFCDSLDRPSEQLRRITEEMRQFETVFVRLRGDGSTVDARIFTIEEELPFAGHPVLGAAAALHERTVPADAHAEWRFVIQGRPVPVITSRSGTYYTAMMNQGRADLSPPLPASVRDEAARSLGLAASDLADLPLRVASTGLPYLIVPVTPDGLARARIARTDFGSWLAGLGASFVYVLDPDASEGRTWDNAGRVEDVATGSAAGPAAGYLRTEGRAGDEPLLLRQGRFVSRPSTLTTTTDGQGNIWVGGPVRPVASGVIETLPPIPGGSADE
jgi:trans-2,3-dihydro-3-hydroxyanthranilate isomerase